MLLSNGLADWDIVDVKFEQSRDFKVHFTRHLKLKRRLRTTQAVFPHNLIQIGVQV